MISRLWIEVGLLTAASFFQGAGFSLIAPFFPEEAFRRKNSPTHVGIVMGVYQLAMFLSSPVFGWALSRSRLKARTLLWTGLLVDGLFSAAFGSVVFIQNPHIFFGTSLLLRTIQSLGNSASMTCYFTLLGADFPDLLGQLIPVIEAAFSAGLIVGPFLGGILFQNVGFTTTFIIFGSNLAFIGVLCAVAFPVTAPPEDRKRLGLWETLRQPRVAGNSLLFLLGLIMVGFNEATLAVHLQQFDLTPAWVGTMFIPCALVQSVFSPLWGRLAASLARPRLVCIIGVFFCAACFGLSGLTSFHDLTSTSSILPTVLAQIFLGMGVGAIYIPAFLDALRFCLVKLRYPDDVGTYGLLSGLLTASLCLGSSIGSAAGGLLLDYLKYSIACYSMFALLLIPMATLLAAPGSPIAKVPSQETVDLLVKPIVPSANSPKETS